jgi:hypothetical protein
MKGFVFPILLTLLLSADVCAQVSDSLFNVVSKYSDIVVLDETMNVKFGGNKISSMVVTITDSSVLVIQDKSGLNYLKPFTLPENLDKLYIMHSPDIRGTDRIYDKITIKNFKVSLLKNGNAFPLKVNKKTELVRVLDSAGYFGTTYKYHFYVDVVNQGDTILLYYKYYFPFDRNVLALLSNRILFDGFYPKKSFKLNWYYNKHMEVDSVFVNVIPPEVTVNNNMIGYHWTLTNLEGALSEPCSRPYLESPYFVFVPKPYDFEYVHFNSFIREFIPPYFFLANKRQSDIRVEMWDNVIGNKNKKNIYFGKVSKKIIAKSKDNRVGLLRMMYFQQYMVDSVKYYDAEKFYSRDINYLKQKSGVDLYRYAVYDNNLEAVYANMIPRLAKDLFTAYPVDKRVGVISKYYCSTVNDNDIIFTVIFNDSTAGYVIPKSDKNNYYFNELPFYYENIPVLLLHIYDYENPRVQLDIDYGSAKRNYNTKFREGITPSSSYDDNYRKIQSEVKVNIAKNSADFNTRIILSGQYSTLTRNVYLNRPVDSTINPKYFLPVWDITDNIKINEVKCSSTNINYPFKIIVNADYSAYDIINEQDSVNEINLSGWFKPVYCEINKYKPRFFNYYPDFAGSDRYSYLLEFDKNLTVVDNEGFELRNDYARVYFEVKQLDDRKILVNFNYDVFGKKVDKKYYNLVLDIYDAISKLDTITLKFKVLN